MRMNIVEMWYVHSDSFYIEHLEREEKKQTIRQSIMKAQFSVPQYFDIYCHLSLIFCSLYKSSP